jgi:hypothetical protein
MSHGPEEFRKPPPEILDEYLRLVAIETARMAWPGSMMRGESQVLRKRAKAVVEKFFAGDGFPMRELWCNARRIGGNYQEWHERICDRLGKVLEPCMGRKRKRVNRPAAVAAKVLDTFMHQLMKRSQMRPLWPHLYLPLDNGVFKALLQLESDHSGKSEIASILKKPPYSLERSDYVKLQSAMLKLLWKLRKRWKEHSLWRSRIELNSWLWTSQRGLTQLLSALQ